MGSVNRRPWLHNGVVLSLVAGLMVGLPPAMALAEPPSSEDVSVPVSPAQSALDPMPEMPGWSGPAPVWPQAASVLVDLPASGSSVLGRAAVSTEVGGLPLRVVPLQSFADDVLSGSKLFQAATAGPARVRVEVLDRGRAQAAGYALAVRVSRADGVAADVRVRVELDYSKFRYGFGGGWSDRLQLMTVPECGLAPQAQALASCPPPLVLPSGNDANAGVVSAEVPLTSSASPVLSFKQADEASSASSSSSSEPAGALVVLAAAQSGETGDFRRTDLKETGSWAAGGSSGDFTYSYPFGVPPVPGGLTPSVALGYSSGAVDGQVTTGNTQPSIVGEGWSYHPGFIERTLRPCKQDQDPAHAPFWTHNDARPLGPCWRYDNYQISLNGRSGELVPTDGTGTRFKLESDDAVRVEKLTGGPTGAWNGEHWRVWDKDGTQYWFGKARLPGWTSGKPETNSVMWQTVFANHTDDPCFYNGRFWDSRCDAMAYRWQLDYVVDPHGNSMAFFYDRDMSRAGQVEPVSGAQGSFPYVRASFLTRIEYGHRAGNEANTTAPARVEFTPADRCLTTSCGTKDGTNWPDTPWDLQCDTYACTNNMGPSYWTSKRLSKVTTKIHVGGGVYRPVDEWVLGHQFPGGVSRPVLWLASVTRKGFNADGSAGESLPALVTFGRLDNNRADYDPNAGMADHLKYRISTLETESGARIIVDYFPVSKDDAATDPGCKFGQAAWPDPASNAHRCFPQQYTNSLGVTGWSWWHKMVAKKVTVADGVAGSPDVVTSYDYSTAGSSNKALWAYTSSVWASKDKVNSRWVGYATVGTTVGVDSGQQSRTQTTYYRGLDGDLTDVYFGTEHYGLGMPQVTFADIDGDGRKDLITDVGSSHQYWVYRNQGYDVAETFVSWDRKLLTSGFGPITGVQFTDVDGDGRADLAATYGSDTWVYRNLGYNAAKTFDGAQSRKVASGFGALHQGALFADIDGDGRSDIIGQYGPEYTLIAYRNQGWNATDVFVGWENKTLVSGFGPLSGVEFADMDADGRADLIACHGPGYDLWTYRNAGWNASSVFPGPTKHLTSGFGLLSAGIEFADMTGDSQADLIHDSGPNHDLWIYKNRGLSETETFAGWERKFVATASDRDEVNNIRRKVTVTDSTGATVPDHPALTGQVREQQTLDGPGGVILAKTITNYQVWQKAGGTLPSWQTPAWRYSYLHRPQWVNTYTRIAGGSYRRTFTGYTHESGYGRLQKVDDQGEVGVTGDDMCTSYEYIDRDDASYYFIGYVKRQATTAKNCATTATYPADGISETRTSYDGLAYNAQFTRGLVTKTESAVSYSGSTPNLIVTGQAGHDGYGRAEWTKDGLGRQTITAYTHTNGLTSSIKVTPPPGVTYAVNTVIDVRRGLPTSVTDANAKTTTAKYDTLGRLVEVKKPGNPTTLPDVSYRYVISKTANYIETKTLGPNGNQISSYDIFDKLLRPRQTQTVTESGKRTITDTRYDKRGLVEKMSIFYNSASAPNSTLVWPTNGDADIARQARYVYDKAGRQVKDQMWQNNAQLWETLTVHDGDRVGVIPPDGGTATQDILDARGRVIEKRQYHTRALSGTFDKTLYGYNRQSQLTSVTDPAGNPWAYEYDLLGRKRKTVDPDAGTSSTVYDNASQVASTVDGRGQALFFEYDNLGRKTKQRDGSATGPIMASWTYDTYAKGQLAEATRHVGTELYTSRVTIWDDAYRPKKAEVIIPASTANGGLAGTYTWEYDYKPNGAPATTKVPGVGGLPAETMTYTYDNNGYAQTTTGSWTGGSQTYVADVEYNYDGLIGKQWLGNTGKRVQLENSYSAGSRRLTLQTTRLESQTTPGTYNTKYTHDYLYDAAGNITGAGTLTDGIRDSAECYRYDHLRRLTEAWTQAAFGSGCLTPTREGAEPYWRQWTFDSIGNRKTQVDKDPVAGDTTWTYQVGAAGGVKPHQLKKVDATGPKAGTPTRTFGYDPAGNTTSAITSSGGSQTLTWDKEGHLATVTEGSETTSYLYDASGNRLIAYTPDKTTLYLPDGTELEKPTEGSVLGTRYYNGVAVRNVTGLKWTISNHQGTSVAQIDSVTLAASRRRMMPYGEDRNTPPADWMGSKGYVGGTRDNTGYTHLGAREYDPTLGRFISVDPIMDLADPQQWHAYTYSNSNPVTWSDPDGNILCGDDDCNLSATPNPGGGHNVTDGRRRPGPAAPPSCSRATPEYCHRPGGNATGAYGLGVQWLFYETRGLFGQGNCLINCAYKRPANIQYFRDGDPFTEGIRTHQAIEDLRRRIAAALAAGDTYGRGDLHYGHSRFSAADRAQLHWDTLDSALTGGRTGMPVEQAFLGSYDLTWSVVGDDNGNEVIEFNLTNASTLNSAIPNPAKVRQEVYGNNCAGCGSDALPGESWTKQSIRWRETFPGGNAPQRPGAWHPTTSFRPSEILKPIWSTVSRVF